MLTHDAKESNLQKALKQDDKLEILHSKTIVIRIEESLELS